MDAKMVWLFVFVALYWSYCIFWGIKTALTTRTATDYFIAGRSISVWVFVLAATATCFSGWTFLGHPGLIYRDGFQYAYASLYAITIPLTGVIFMKRQWMLGRRFGFITPGEMFANYFKSDILRLLVVLVALVFSVPYLGVQLRASGFLFNVLTDGRLSVDAGMWLLSIVMIIYVMLGGLRAVAFVDTMQAILKISGIVIIGLITLYYVGGWEKLNAGIAALARMDALRTPDKYSHYVAMPGVIQWVSDGTLARGGAWTSMMVLTYMIAVMGIQASPAFSMWAFSNHNPKSFAIQQVWLSALIVGLVLVIFSTIQGIGSHFLGADQNFLSTYPRLTRNVLGPILGGVDLMETDNQQEALVPALIDLMTRQAPWLVGFLAVCALAAMQSTGAAYMSTAGAMLTRDVLKRYIMPKATHGQQMLWGRLGVVFVMLAALLVATKATDAIVLLGGLAVAYGLQMWPALIAVCWWPWLTRQGIVIGLLAGLIAVTVTDSIGQEWLGITAWGRWPLTIHSAGWGIFCNLTLAILVSFFTQDPAEKQHRMMYHQFLQEHAGLPSAKRDLVPIAWGITLAWFFFGVGPGAMLGNNLFGDPNRPSTWVLGIPSIWAWQIVWWGIGVFMIWFLAYVMEMSTIPKKEVVALQEDIGDIQLDVVKPPRFMLERKP